MLIVRKNSLSAVLLIQKIVANSRVAGGHYRVIFHNFIATSAHAGSQISLYIIPVYTYLIHINWWRKFMFNLKLVVDTKSAPRLEGKRK
jgi:hypothetical protein